MLASIAVPSASIAGRELTSSARRAQLPRAETKEWQQFSLLAPARALASRTALAFGKAGHRVVATMRNPARAPELANLAGQDGLAITVYPMDVDLDASVSEAIGREHGPIDVLVNNAGIERMGSVERAPALLTSAPSWRPTTLEPFAAFRQFCQQCGNGAAAASSVCDLQPCRPPFSRLQHVSTFRLDLVCRRSNFWAGRSVDRSLRACIVDTTKPKQNVAITGGPCGQRRTDSAEAAETLPSA